MSREEARLAQCSATECTQCTCTHPAGSEACYCLSIPRSINPFVDNMYDGVSIHPLEQMFVKVWNARALHAAIPSMEPLLLQLAVRLQA